MHPPAITGAKAATQLQPMVIRNYVMPSQSHTHQVTSAAIFSWYIIDGERGCGFGLWRVIAERGCGMCRSARSRQQVASRGVKGQVSLAKKVSSCHVLLAGTLQHRHLQECERISATCTNCAV